MTIACVRCGGKQEGEIITNAISFRFPHSKTCGHGIGRLVVIRGNKVRKPTNPEVKKTEEIPKKDKPVVEKLKVFGKHNDTTTTNTTTTNTTT